MSSLDPPSIKPNAAPDFTDSSGCAKWLQSLPLINVGPSHVRLLAQLDELNACSIAPAERLKILELLREPVSFVQKEHSKKFSSRPAPLAKPGKLTPRQIELISLWLERWTPKVSIGRAPAAAGDGAAPLVIDLSGAAGASRRMSEGDTTRVLDIHELGSSVRKRVGLLREGETPAALGLGEDVTAPLAESLLTMLYRRWCEDKQSRAHPRRGASGTAQICSGMAAVHYFVTGRVFGARGGPQKISQVQHEQIATLGRVTTRHEDEPDPPPDFAVETWQIKDESASGLRLARVDTAASSRLMLGQLLGIRLADAKAFLLCAVKWLSVSAELELRAGVHILPGIPQGAAIRAVDGHAAAEQYTQAFLLPAVAALQAPETLVVPAGWFKPNREIEVLAERSGKLRLASLVDRGADFERVTFETL